MLVLATHGRAIESSEYLGRVAEAVIARTERRILLVRPAAAAQTGTHVGELRRCLLPLDGTPTTAAALQPATALAARLGASIDVLYVVDPERPPQPERGSVGLSRYADQAHHEWASWTREIVDRLCTCLAQCPADVPVRVHLAYGKTGVAIVEFAAEHRTDVIALVRRSRLEPGRAAILRAVLDTTPCPILLCAGPCS
jgi:nucleotide-binding universal stress UspA family protein